MNVHFNTNNLNTNKKIYKCSICDKLFNWNDNSYWYGSYKDLENNPEKIKYYCSENCIENKKNMDAKKEAKNYLNKYFKSQYINENDDKFKSLVRLLNNVKKTQKMLDTENYVKKYIEDYGKPPTYRQVAKDFNISVCAVYARLRNCRELMKHK